LGEIKKLDPRFSTFPKKMPSNDPNFDLNHWELFSLFLKMQIITQGLDATGSHYTDTLPEHVCFKVVIKF
jgi:hypothetical protein